MTADTSDGGPIRPSGDQAAAWFGVGVAIVVGTAVRVLPFIGGDFPLNDGGLFASMVADLVRNGFAVPDFTTYNGGAIPYAYPPLALYAAGALNANLGIPLTDLLRFLPLVFSVATIPAIYWVASGMLGTRTGGALAAVSFALLPRAYWWMITGGGLTRSLGLTLAVIGLGLAWRLTRSRNPRWGMTVGLGVVGGLTVLAHPQAGVFLAVSTLLFALWQYPRRRAASQIAAAGLVGAAVMAPWLWVVLVRHGVDPILSAIASGGGITEGLFNLLSFRSTEMAFLDLIGIAGLVGAGLALRRRDFLLPVWLASVWIVDSRAGSTFSMVPLSILAAYCLLAIGENWLPSNGVKPWTWLTDRPVRTLGLTVLLVALAVGNYVSALTEESPLFPLSVEQRQAMLWVRDHADSDARFAVLTGTDLWASDAVSEWFPTVTSATSVATVQGSEWLGVATWDRQLDSSRELQRCAVDALPCVLAWEDAFDTEVSHVFIPKGQLHGPLSEHDCCPAPRATIELVRGARVIYDGPGATIIELP